jgi:hypothetical protein
VIHCIVYIKPYDYIVSTRLSHDEAPATFFAITSRFFTSKICFLLPSALRISHDAMIVVALHSMLNSRCGLEMVEPSSRRWLRCHWLTAKLSLPKDFSLLVDVYVHHTRVVPAVPASMSDGHVSIGRLPAIEGLHTDPTYMFPTPRQTSSASSSRALVTLGEHTGRSYDCIRRSSVSDNLQETFKNKFTGE